MSQVEIDWGDLLDSDMAEKFEAFHAANPHVYETIVFRALVLKKRGHRRVGIASIFESMRWDHLMSTDGSEPFKLNNNYRAYYTRLIEHRVPDLRDFFTRRESKADSHKNKVDTGCIPV